MISKETQLSPVYINNQKRITSIAFANWIALEGFRFQKVKDRITLAESILWMKGNKNFKTSEVYDLFLKFLNGK